MTIAIGVAPTDGSGAVLLCDSMTFSVGPGGTATAYELSARGKRGLFPGFAFVAAGRWPDAGRLRLAQDGPFVEKLEALWSLLMSQPADPIALEAGTGLVDFEAEAVRANSIELVAARVPCGWNGEPVVGMIQPGLEALVMPGQGAVFICGSPRLWADENGLADTPPPADLAAAQALAVEIARRYIAEWYAGRTLEEILATGVLPPVAGPLHVYTITAEGVLDEEVAA